MALLLILGILVFGCAALLVSSLRQGADHEGRSVSPLVPPDASGDPASETRQDADRAERVDGGYHWNLFI